MDQDLNDLKGICARILARQKAGEYDLPEDTFHGLTFEEVLALIVDDYIPTMKVAA